MKINLKRLALWITIVTALSILYVFLSWNKVAKFFDFDTQLDSKIVRNVSIVMPEIIVCPHLDKNGDTFSVLNYTKLEELWKSGFQNKSFIEAISVQNQYAIIGNYLLAKLGLETLWNEAQIHISRLLKVCLINHSVSCEKINKYDTINSPSGICLKFFPKEINTSGVNSGVQMIFDKDELHPKQPMVLKIILKCQHPTPSIQVAYGSFLLKSGWEIDVQLQISKTTLMNRKEQLCSEDVFHKEFSECIFETESKHLYSKYKCRMPYMKEFPGSVDCNSTFFRDAKISFYSDNVKLGHKTAVAHSYECIEPCEKTIYYPHTRFFNLGSHESSQAVIQFYVGSLDFQDIRENYIYTINILLTDLGSFFNLIFGMSASVALWASYNICVTIKDYLVATYRKYNKHSNTLD